MSAQDLANLHNLLGEFAEQETDNANEYTIILKVLELVARNFNRKVKENQ